MVHTEVDLKCFHCGQPCGEDLSWLNDKAFCCYGCKTVFEILDSNYLCEYYDFNQAPGIHREEDRDTDFLWLDEATVKKQLLSFDSATYAKVNFYIPAIHCISCVWLLEHLHRVDKGILKSEVNFARKQVSIDFNPAAVKLSRIAYWLDTLGYAPLVNLENKEEQRSPAQKTLVLKLAVAGFCFGNVMLFSFPEYLGIDQHDQSLLRIFSMLNWLLSVPVFFYSGFDYLRSASRSFKQRQINIDVPIAAGLMALFLRSSYDILTASGPGYLDSFTGLVFFLLIGRWFQGMTYEQLAFDRDYKSYFPLTIQKWIGKAWKPVVIYELKKDDVIRVRNREIIPADGILNDDHAYIDYSFVTGESRPVKVHRGELIYAGGKLIGQPVEVKVQQPASQSHLTSLWNHDAFRKKDENKYQKIIDLAARRFTWIVMGIAALTAVYWHLTQPSQMWLVLTSVLMVACPCALALAAPFTYGSMLRVFGRHHLYLKNADVIERMASIDSIVFDKTGTLTYNKNPEVEFHGELTVEEEAYVKCLASCSTHPLSVIVAQAIAGTKSFAIGDFREIPGKGIEGSIEGTFVQMGSAAFTGAGSTVINPSSVVFVSIDSEIRGYYSITATLRANIRPMLKRLGTMFTALLSGDHDTDRAMMKGIAAPGTDLLFEQSPHDKLNYIRTQQQKGNRVMMLGDGLNDAGAMRQSDVGIAVTDDTGTFTPGCDGIIQGDHLDRLDGFLSLARSSSIILKSAFAISFGYNAIALGFAVSGHLTPLVAAVLMPVSSISVVGFSTLAVNHVARKKFNNV